MDHVSRSRRGAPDTVLEILQGFNTISELPMRILLRFLRVYSGFRVLHFTCVQGAKSDAARRAASDFFNYENYGWELKNPPKIFSATATGSLQAILSSFGNAHRQHVPSGIPSGQARSWTDIALVQTLPHSYSTFGQSPK